MKKLLIAFSILLASFLPQAHAQCVGFCTTVTATLTDSTTQVWAQATVSANLINTLNNQPMLNNGVPINSPNNTFQADGTGTFSVSLDDNFRVSPAGSKWRFTMCPNANTGPCSQLLVQVTGASINLSTLLSSALITPVVNPGGPIYRAYNDAEVFGGQGGMYWNVTSNTLRGCPTMLCSGNSWTAVGGGGGGFVAGGDLSGSSSSQNVIGILSHPLPSISTGFLNWTGTNWSFGAGGVTSPGSPSLSLQGNCSGSFCGVAGLKFTLPAGVNPANVTSDLQNNVITVTPDYNFTACGTGCSSTTSPTTLANGANTVTMTPCPVGINGTDTFHYLWITPSAFDTAPASPVLVSGGTCTSGLATGTVIFTSFFPYITGYTIGSSSSGIQEAWNTLVNPGATIKLIPNNVYSCLAPISLGNVNNITFDGQWAIIHHQSFGSCLVVGGGSFGTQNGGFSADIEHIDMRPVTVPWSISLTSPIAAGSANATITATTCPAGFYAAIPNQLLWLNGNGNGIPQTAYGTGEYVLTTTGGTCTPGLTNGTINIVEATPGVATIAVHDVGTTLSSNVGAYIEDTMAISGHFHDLRFAPNFLTTIGEGHLLQINNDQACEIDNINGQSGSIFRNDADFQGAGVFSPGGIGGSICKIRNFASGSGGYGVLWFSGNDIDIDEAVFQNYTVAGVVLGRKRGGFGHFNLGHLIHFEIGTITGSYGAVIGIPAVLLVGGGTISSHTNYLEYANGQNPFSASYGGNWPIYSSIGGSTNAQYYYLVAHNNLATGCTSTDCRSVPVLIGIAFNDDPSTNNVILKWFGWGAGVNPGSGGNADPVTSYDILRVQNTGQTPNLYYPIPAGTGNYLVTSGLVPGTVCSVKNICTFTDSVATASLASYTPNTNNLLTFGPLAMNMPGSVAITGTGGAGSVVSLVGYGYYVGPPTCLNSMKPVFDAESVGNNGYAAEYTEAYEFLCTQGAAPIKLAGGSAKGFVISNGTGSSPNNTANFHAATAGTTTIATGQTTITVDSFFVTPWSTVQISEDSSKGSLLGVTCNTTTGRTYSVTGLVPGVSVTITSSAAPSTNPACLDVTIIN